MSAPVPLEITRADEWDVRIRWSDGHEAVYAATYLRHRCPCAVCQSATLPASVAVHPVAIRKVGAYAIQFDWSDGHSTGVYSYAYLRGICPCPTCTKRVPKTL